MPIANGTNSSVFSASQKTRGITFGDSCQGMHGTTRLTVGLITCAPLHALSNWPMQHRALQAPPLLQSPLLLA